MAVAAGIGLGVVAGLVNAVVVWQTDGQTPVAISPGATPAADGPAVRWSATPVFLTSVIVHAALGALLGAALGGLRRLRSRANETRSVVREVLRDIVALSFFVVALYVVGSAIPALLWRDAGFALALLVGGGLLGAWAAARLAAWLIAGALERWLARPGVSGALARVPWRGLGAGAAIVLVAGALIPPLFAAAPTESAPGRVAAPADAPNVLLLVLDTTRADRLSAYGHRRETTPQIDRIASRGVLYEHAISAGVWTLPGHAGIFSGAPSSVHGANGARLFLDPSITTLAEVLARHGFATAGFSNNPWVTHATGLARGFEHFEDHWRSRRLAPVRLLHNAWEEMVILWRNVEGSGGAAYTLGRASDWIDRRRAAPSGEPAAPFFVFVNLMEPHEPRTYRPGHTDLFADPEQTPDRLRKVPHEATAIAVRGSTLSREQMKLLRVLYDGELRYVDAEIGAFVDHLEASGVLDDTLLVITSDHGEAIGDHGRTNHLQNVYEELVRVPLILRHPRLPAGRRVATRVQTFDLFRTIAEFVGIEGPLPDDARLSRNLVDPALLAGTAPPRPVVAEEEPSEWGIRLLRSLRGDDVDVESLRGRYKAYYEKDLKLVWRADGEHELYHLGRDPRELKNLAGKRPRVTRRLEGELEAWLADLPANRIEDAADAPAMQFDAETERSLRALGYIE